MNRKFQLCSFESRRETEMRSLIERFGAEPTIAPSMREITREEHPEVTTFGTALLAGELDAVIFMTGVGARAVLEILGKEHPEIDWTAKLNQLTIIVRGPKPVAVLRPLGVRIDYRAPEPNTWRELLQLLDEAEYELSGQRVAIQEYGVSNVKLLEALGSRGAEMVPVPIYKWELPEDLAPLQQAIRSTCQQEFDALLFTSAQQVVHVMKVAEQLGLKQEFLDAAKQTLIASIGPTCTERLVELGFEVGCEPEHPKMGPLVRFAIEKLGNS